MKKIALIGSTGSIGRQVLDIVRMHGDKFKIVSMASGRNSDLFKEQVKEFAPEYFATAEDGGAETAAEWESADIVFNAAGGFDGLKYSLKAIEAGKTLALANKESLVCGGELVTRLAKMCGVEIIPVDSEHSAIWQCMHFDKATRVKRLIITASGGAFRGYTPEMLEKVTPEQALNHPTWKMGKKITVDSATLMNKGYEVIEAHILYGVPYNNIYTVIQPQSIVHSLVEFDDGSCLAQMSNPDMRIPVQLALTYPERFVSPVPPLDFSKAFSVGFQPLFRENYPLYDLALKCAEKGGTAPCALNAADEIAVGAFLAGRIGFTDIFGVVEKTLSHIKLAKAENFEILYETDEKARELARSVINKK